jgi:epsilon-lactone hydrolase
MILWLAFLFLLLGVRVAARRLLRGRRRPSWSWRQETLFELMRRQTARWGRHGVVELQRRTARMGVPERLLRRRVTVEAVDAGGVPAEWITPRVDVGPRVVLYLHGGGYVCCSPRTHRELTARIAIAAGARVLALDYRLAPRHPFPAALDDARDALRWLLGQVSSDRVVVAGDSAGGGLALALLVSLRDEGEPLPAGAVLISPWTDLADDAPSPPENVRYDYIPRELLRDCREAYTGAAGAGHPLVSPMLAELRGLPPLLIHVGGVEVLHDQIGRLALRTRTAGVDTTLVVGEDLVHVGPTFAAVAPSARQAIREIGEFIRRRTSSVTVALS